MTRQSISLSPPNDEWLKAQIDSREFASKSEIINDLIRKAREIEYIRGRLIKAEKSGFTTSSPSEILREAKTIAKDNGEL